MNTWAFLLLVTIAYASQLAAPDIDDIVPEGISDVSEMLLQHELPYERAAIAKASDGFVRDLDGPPHKNNLMATKMKAMPARAATWKSLGAAAHKVQHRVHHILQVGFKPHTEPHTVKVDWRPNPAQLARGKARAERALKQAVSHRLRIRGPPAGATTTARSIFSRASTHPPRPHASEAQQEAKKIYRIGAGYKKATVDLRAPFPDSDDTARSFATSTRPEVVYKTPYEERREKARVHEQEAMEKSARIGKVRRLMHSTAAAVKTHIKAMSRKEASAKIAEQAATHKANVAENAKKAAIKAHEAVNKAKRSAADTHGSKKAKAQRQARKLVAKLRKAKHKAKKVVHAAKKMKTAARKVNAKFAEAKSKANQAILKHKAAQRVLRHNMHIHTQRSRELRQIHEAVPHRRHETVPHKKITEIHSAEKRGNEKAVKKAPQRIKKVYDRTLKKMRHVRTAEQQKDEQKRKAANKKGRIKTKKTKLRSKRRAAGRKEKGRHKELAAKSVRSAEKTKVAIDRVRVASAKESVKNLKKKAKNARKKAKNARKKAKNARKKETKVRK